MTAEPTLLLCVGATKAGTSWLYQHLRSHPDCHLRAIKELSYFTTVETGAYGRQIRLHSRVADRLAASGVARPGRGAARARDVAAWLQVLRRRVEDVPAYLSYLTDGIGARRLVGDVTPAYALLPEARLRQMAAMTSDVRFLYLLRDPLARLWSHVRMLAVRAAQEASEVPARARAILARVLAGEETAVATRGDYAGVIGRLTAAVPSGKLAVMVQDEVMTPPGLARLWAFLGIGAGNAQFDLRVHRGVDVPLESDQAAAARVWLQPQYDFVEAMFGRLPQGWQRHGSGVAA